MRSRTTRPRRPVSQRPEPQGMGGMPTRDMDVLRSRMLNRPSTGTPTPRAAATPGRYRGYTTPPATGGTAGRMNMMRGLGTRTGRGMRRTTPGMPVEPTPMPTATPTLSPVAGNPPSPARMGNLPLQKPWMTTPPTPKNSWDKFRENWPL